jgi:hypothetical protein
VSPSGPGRTLYGLRIALGIHPCEGNGEDEERRGQDRVADQVRSKDHERGNSRDRRHSAPPGQNAGSPGCDCGEGKGEDESQGHPEP